MTSRPLALRGGIEPHADMLNAPAADKLLYKMMTVDNLLRSVRETSALGILPETGDEADRLQKLIVMTIAAEP